MSDELLPYYNRELSYVRQLGAQFADRHPKIAGRLRLGPDGSEDPHVARLMEAFAFLNARIHHKLDEDLPEVTDALLGVLYPHYQAPIPALTIAQLLLDPAQVELTAGYTVPAGSVLETEPVEGTPCRFRTCYPVTLWPIEVQQANRVHRPFPTSTATQAVEAESLLRLVLRCRSGALTFAGLNLGRLRLYLAGQPQHAFALYELLARHTVEITLASPTQDGTPTVLDRRCLEPVGFGRDEGLLPYPRRSFLGYRLLTEFFAFPEKFLFLDLTGLDQAALAEIGNTLEIRFYLRQAPPDLEPVFSADNFRLGCTPLVNLYQQRAEPIQLTQTQTEYRVVPDARRPGTMEVYSIDRVTATSPRGEQMEFLPFFSVKHARREPRAFWLASRRPAESADPGGAGATEFFLSLVDLELRPAQPANWTVSVETTCSNRELPSRLPFGGGQPYLQWTEGDLVSRVLCLTPPTPTRPPAVKRGAMWRLISHLTLNHLSLEDDIDGADALREILSLYDYVGSPNTQAMIEGILNIHTRRVVGRVGYGPEALCRGVEVSVHFDEERFAGRSLYLFASVLERFFALYCSVNSFSRLIATTKQHKGEFCRWGPRTGEKIML